MNSAAGEGNIVAVVPCSFLSQLMAETFPSM